MAATNITATKDVPKTIPFRTLRANEITCSLVDVGENGALVLLYPNPAAVQDILDEAVGQIGWQRKHYAVGGGVYCSLGVRMGDCFIWKDDAGDCNGTEKVKGSATDSFLRAARLFGIGRELLNLPKLRLSAEQLSISIEKDPRSGRVTRAICKDKLHVDSISYDDNRNILAYTLINQSGKKILWQRQ